VAIAGADLGAGTALIGGQSIRTARDVQGTKVIVDSPNSGLAFVLYGVLKDTATLIKADYTVKVSSYCTAVEA
jgi:TRAP-type uncharacterized transport system substrate-binding protein